MYKTYDIWRRYHSENVWNKTTHSVQARTDKEAQSKMQRKFAGHGFSSMSLVAIESGQVPQ